MKKPATTTQILSRLRMRQILLLLDIEQHGTLRAASEDLGLTQPAASKMLHELEATLGHPLFERIGRRLKLTPSGNCVLHHFRGLRGTMEALNRELQEMQLGGAGKLSVGTIMAPAPTHLIDALVGLKKLYPLLSIEILVDTSNHLIEQLRDGAMDVVIGRVPDAASPANHDCLFRPIDDEPLSVVVAREHPLASNGRKKQLKFGALLAYPWILQPRGSPMREVIEQEFLSHHAALPPGLIETASIPTTTSLIARSELIAVIPHSIAGRYEHHDLLRILPYAFKHNLTAWGSLIYRNRPVNAVMRAFMTLLHKREQTSP